MANVTSTRAFYSQPARRLAAIIRVHRRRRHHCRRFASATDRGTGSVTRRSQPRKTEPATDVYERNHPHVSGACRRPFRRFRLPRARLHIISFRHARFVRIHRVRSRDRWRHLSSPLNGERADVS